MQSGMEGLLACFFSFVQINQRGRIINGKKFKKYNMFFYIIPVDNYMLAM